MLLSHDIILKPSVIAGWNYKFGSSDNPMFYFGKLSNYFVNCLVKVIHRQINFLANIMNRFDKLYTRAEWRAYVSRT